MTIEEMIKQLKAAGYSIIRTERLGILQAEFIVDPFELNLRKDHEGYLEYNQKRACDQLGHMIAKTLFGVLEFKKIGDETRFDTYRTEVTIIKPVSQVRDE